METDANIVSDYALIILLLLLLRKYGGEEKAGRGFCPLYPQLNR
jgi:hypothetical protein